jgi:hypothetical protein
MAVDLGVDISTTQEKEAMQSYYVYALGQLSSERSDESARAYQQEAKPLSSAPKLAGNVRLKRVVARVRVLSRALAYLA